MATIATTERTFAPTLGMCARATKTVYICSHTTPDLDAVASTRALAHLLESVAKGTRVHAVAPDDIMDLFKWTGGPELTRPEEVDEAALFIFCDLADESRLGRGGRRLWDALTENSVVAVIDHHEPTSSKLLEKAHLVLCDPEAPSTTELIFQCAKALGPRHLDPTLSTLLLAGLAGDTGHFTNASTTSRALGCAHELAEHGADLNLVRTHARDTHSPAYLKAEAEIYRTMEVEDGLAISTIPKERLRTLGVAEDEIPQLKNSLKRLDGMDVSILVIEDGDAMSYSVRTSSELSARAIAQALGGGGHERAAGCRLSGNAKELTARVAEAARRNIEKKRSQK